MVHIGTIGLFLLLWKLTEESNRHDDSIGELLNAGRTKVLTQTTRCMRHVALCAIRVETSCRKWLDYSQTSN